MANSALTLQPTELNAVIPLHKDGEIWEGLKEVIIASSEFQRWNLDRCFHETDSIPLNLDSLVRLYLRETLATLAY